MAVSNTRDDVFDSLLRQLKDRASAKRRSAAKNLRKLDGGKACGALLEALQHELQDPRTWETKYQMIMALAECECTRAIELIQALSKAPEEYNTIQLAVGEAMVRLGRLFPNDPTPVLEILAHAEVYSEYVVSGALRGVARLKLRFDLDIVKRIISKVLALNNHGAIFWAVAACPGWGWKNEIVRGFLQACVDHPGYKETRVAAEAALQGKYMKWNVL